MVHHDPALDAVFAALASPTRRAMLAALARGTHTVSDLAAPFDVSLPAISKHLRVLEDAGLIARRRQGRRQQCRLVAGPMRDAAAWITRYRRFWEDRFDALDEYLAATTPTPRRRRRPGR